MSIGADSVCLECYLQRSLRTARPLGDEKTATLFAKELMGMMSRLPEDKSTMYLSDGVSELLKKYYGLEGDRYREEKQQSNAFVLERLEQIREMAEQAADPILAGMQLAILGNYLDFGALQGQVSFEELEQMLRQALRQELDAGAMEGLKADLSKAKRLLYITDNAGEIGFDRVFAEQIHRLYPNVEITFCVRGGPAMNDATREDAALVGVPFPVIDNGNTVPGTELSLLSREAKQALEEADVVISKGMANVETLYGCGYHIYYAFLIKCQRFEKLFGKPKMTPMLLREKQ